MAVDRATALRETEKLLRTGKLRDAIDVYLRILAEHPEDAETSKLLGQLYLRVGDPDKAVERLAAAADLLRRDGDREGAAALCSKIVAVRPDHEYAALQQGEMALAEGRTADACAKFAAVADAREARGDRRGAGELRIRIAALDPKNVDAHLRAARARLELDPRSAFSSGVQAGTQPHERAKPETIPAAASPKVQVRPRPAEAKADMKKAIGSSRARLVVTGIALIALVSGGTLIGRWYFVPQANAAVTGTLVVDSNPASVDLIVDGQRRGATPWRGALNPGKHTIELVNGERRRTLSVTIAAGSETAQFIELPQAAPQHGRLVVRTDPPGAEVSVDGQAQGTSPLTVADLTPGIHTVALVSRLGSMTQRVTIEAGATASLVVPLGAPQGAPVSGWISIAAPVDVQVFEDQRLLGSSKTDRIMVPVGRHDLEFVNEALGYRGTRTVQVSAGQVSVVRPEWPKGSVALNAQPWAEIWIDGERVGETPVGNLSLPIGPHEVVFRHPELGERRYNAMVTSAAVTRLSVDLRKKS